MRRFKNSLLLVILAVAALAQTASEKPSLDVRRVGMRLQCQCGCKDSVATCSMLECGFSKPAKEKIARMLAIGMTDQQIFDSFVAKYGATVLAAPTTKGFDLVAWIAPFAVFAAALLLTILLIRRWGGLGGKKAVPATLVAESSDPEDRERLQRIRRETGDGGL